MPAHPRLQRRGSRYFLRAKVPEGLRQAVGKQEIREALGTSVYVEALDRGRVASVEVDALFARRRRELTARAETKPTEAELFQAVPAWFHGEERAANDRFGPLEDEYDREDRLQTLDEDESRLIGPEGSTASRRRPMPCWPPTAWLSRLGAVVGGAWLIGPTVPW